MPKEVLAIKSVFKDFPVDQLQFTDFFFLDVKTEGDRFIEATPEQTARYWNLKAQVHAEMTGNTLEDVKYMNQVLDDSENPAPAKEE
jgi:hypothetical protein